MSTAFREPTTKAERLRQIMDVCLKEDIENLKGFPLRETSVNLGIGFLFLLMAVLHLLHTICQFGFSLVAAISDLLVKGLVKIMPAPKMAKEADRGVQ